MIKIRTFIRNNVFNDFCSNVFFIIAIIISILYCVESIQNDYFLITNVGFVFFFFFIGLGIKMRDKSVIGNWRQNFLFFLNTHFCRFVNSIIIIAIVLHLLLFFSEPNVKVQLGIALIIYSLSTVYYIFKHRDSSKLPRLDECSWDSFYWYCGAIPLFVLSFIFIVKYKITKHLRFECLKEIRFFLMNTHSSLWFEYSLVLLTLFWFGKKMRNIYMQKRYNEKQLMNLDFCATISIIPLTVIWAVCDSIELIKVPFSLLMLEFLLVQVGVKYFQMNYVKEKRINV